ncbi:MAG: hypothetical protein JW801_18635 [Bacteroidales bacterium]|nr:hypothetical protein [Bacteroidales bacterium]
MTEPTPEILVDPEVAKGSSLVFFAYRSPESVLFLLGEEALEDIESLKPDIPFSALLEKDPSLKEIENLPAGFRAHREKSNDPWDIAQLDPKTGQGDYLDGYLEWINKMYVDGYFTGGTVPHWYTYPGRPGLYGWISLLAGIILLGVTLLISYLNTGKLHKDVVGPAIFGLFFIGIGISVLVRLKGKKKGA